MSEPKVPDHADMLEFLPLEFSTINFWFRPLPLAGLNLNTDTGTVSVIVLHPYYLHTEIKG